MSTPTPPPEERALRNRRIIEELRAQYTPIVERLEPAVEPAMNFAARTEKPVADKEK